jgi:predicted RNase H-like nuclease (RuvC/YqgF family)
LDEKLRQLRDPSNKERNKKRKIEETEVEVKAMLSKLKGIQESLRKAMENMAREKSIKNVELSSEITNLTVKKSGCFSIK